jgi:5-methylcytosine-specific restriction endonuclease McrA
VKTCITCKETKEFALFPERKDSPDGYRNQCKVCRKKYTEEWIKNPPVKIIVPDGMKRCYVCKNIKDKSCFGNNAGSKDGLKQLCKICAQNKREEAARAQGRVYRKRKEDGIPVEKTQEQLDKEKESKHTRQHEWYLKNKEKVYAGKARRRAKKFGCKESYSTTGRKITLIAFDSKCYSCGGGDCLCIDHHRPLSKGNPLSLDNAVVLCKKCNSKKASKDPEEFYGAEACRLLDEKLSSILEENKDKLKEN